MKPAIFWACPIMSFPIAGLAVGQTAETPEPSLRLPCPAPSTKTATAAPTLDLTSKPMIKGGRAHNPTRPQRQTETLGPTEPCTWSEDKARQYSLPERTDFGACLAADNRRGDPV